MGLHEYELRQLFGQWGDVVSVQQADAAPDEAIVVEFSTFEAAEEAIRMVNLGLIRRKTVRCMLISALELIRGTMVSGNRLIIENLDPAIEMQGMWDICSLFGQVLD